MLKPSLTGLLLLSTAALLAACGEPEDTRPGQPVKQRQQAFKEIIKSFEPMGVMLRKGSYEADRFLAFAEKLHAARELPWRHFGADTNYPPTKAKAETRPVNYRLPVSLLEQLDAAAEREGVGPRQKTAFVAWLLKASLDALEDGSLTPPRRESIDL